MNNTFNYEMVQLARESRGWTQKELSERAGITQGFISLLEGGQKDVSEDKLIQLANSLGYPVEFFYQRDTYEGFGLSLLYYRKKASTRKGDLKRLQAEKNIRRMQFRTMFNGVDIESKYSFDFFDINEHDGEVEKIAQFVRANWRMPIGPVNNLTSTIERAGGIVLRFDFGTRDIDALSEWPDDTPPIFYVNSQAPADRARFSLAHELGHIVMHNNASETMEYEADRFASEFLMPERDIATQLDSITLRRAGSLKPHWKTSMASLVRRAKDLNRISPERYTRICREISKLGYRKKEPVSIEYEHPTLASKISEVFQESNHFSDDELARMLYIYPDDLRRYRPKQSGLRIA